MDRTNTLARRRGEASARGLPEDAVFEVLAGPHSYTAEMQVKALDCSRTTGSGRGVGRVVPSFALSEPVDRDGQVAIAALPGVEVTAWSPVPRRLSPRWSCTGEGPRVVTLGPIADGSSGAGYGAALVCPLTSTPGLRAWGTVGAGNRVLGAVAGSQAESAGGYRGCTWLGSGCRGHGVPFVVVEPLTVASFNRRTPTGCMYGSWDGRLSRVQDAAARGIAGRSCPRCLIEAVDRAECVAR